MKNVQGVYRINQDNADYIIETFSVKKELQKMKKHETIKDEIIIMVSPSEKLEQNCSKWEVFQQEDRGERSTIINNIMAFIKFIKNQNIPVSLYSFTRDIREISLESDEDDIKNEILRGNNDSGSCNLLRSTVSLFEVVNKKNWDKNPQGKFLRIIVFSKKFDDPVEAEEIKDEINIFTSSNRNYEGAVLNLMFFEDYPAFNKVIAPSEYFRQITDQREFDDSLSKSSRSIDFLYKLLSNSKISMNEISKKFQNLQDEILSNEEISNYADSFDEKYALIKQCYQALRKDYKITSKSSTRNSQREAIRAKINNDVVSTNMVEKIFSERKIQTEDMYLKIEKLLENITKKKEDLKEDLSAIEDELNEARIEENCSFWEKKKEYVENQRKLIENSIDKITSAASFVGYTEEKTRELINFINGPE